MRAAGCRGRRPAARYCYREETKIFNKWINKKKITVHLKEQLRVRWGKTHEAQTGTQTASIRHCYCQSQRCFFFWHQFRSLFQRSPFILLLPLRDCQQSLRTSVRSVLLEFLIHLSHFHLQSLCVRKQRPGYHTPHCQWLNPQRC